MTAIALQLPDNVGITLAACLAPPKTEAHWQPTGAWKAISANIAVIQAGKAARRDLPHVQEAHERENCPNLFLRTQCRQATVGAPLYLNDGKDLTGVMTSPINFAQTVEGAALARADIMALVAGSGAAHLFDCDLDEADLADLDLAGWRFERCSLRRADMTKANLERTQWLSCRAPFASFFSADLTEATIRSCDFNNANLRHARLTSARLTGCKLTGADLTDARIIDLHCEEVLLASAKLAGLSFRKQHLRRLDFSQADLRKADLRDVVFEACSLRDALLAGARFDRADLRGADLGGLRLVDAGLFRGATISHEQAAQLLAELGLHLG
jgi:uncharacterized protein YjbI with pentapeptide repeats